MRKPEYIRATGANCGIYCLGMVLKAYGYSVELGKLSKLLIESGITISGELYTEKSIVDTLDIINKEYGYKIEIEIEEFNSSRELTNIAHKYKDVHYIVIPYYAFQGMPITSKKPNMNRGHWAIIYEADQDKLFGAQTNSKAEVFELLRYISSKTIYDSNICLRDIKVDMGKYNKCDIKVCKSDLGVVPRCGEDKCSLNGNPSKICIYKSDIANKAFIIKKGEDENGKNNSRIAK